MIHSIVKGTGAIRDDIQKLLEEFHSIKITTPIYFFSHNLPGIIPKHYFPATLKSAAITIKGLMGLTHLNSSCDASIINSLKKISQPESVKVFNEYPFIQKGFKTLYTPKRGYPGHLLKITIEKDEQSYFIYFREIINEKEFINVVSSIIFPENNKP